MSQPKRKGRTRRNPQRPFSLVSLAISATVIPALFVAAFVVAQGMALTDFANGLLLMAGIIFVMGAASVSLYDNSPPQFYGHDRSASLQPLPQRERRARPRGAKIFPAAIIAAALLAGSSLLLTLLL